MNYLPGNIVDLLLVLGGLQGFILCLFLLIVKKNRHSNRILALLVFFWSLSSIVSTYRGSDLYILHPHLIKAFSPQSLLFYPLLYLYVRYLINPINKYLFVDLLHFIPFIIRIVGFIPFYILPAETKLEMYQEGDSIFSILDLMVNLTVILQGIIYSFVSVRMINRYQIRIRENFSNIDRIVLNWLRSLIILGLVGLIFGSLATFMTAGNDSVVELWDMVMLFIIATIYLISYKSLKYPEIFNYVTIKSGSETMVEVVETPAGQTDPGPEYYNKLVEFMDAEKPYLNPDLNLQSLADSLGMTRHQLSGLINIRFRKTFYDVIHDYRVKETLFRLQSTEHENFTLESIAYSSGFNSKATFNRVFKKVTGKTPSEYIEELQN